MPPWPIASTMRYRSLTVRPMSGSASAAGGGGGEGEARMRVSSRWTTVLQRVKHQDYRSHGSKCRRIVVICGAGMSMRDKVEELRRRRAEALRMGGEERL